MHTLSLKGANDLNKQTHKQNPSKCDVLGSGLRVEAPLRAPPGTCQVNTASPATKPPREQSSVAAST